MMQAVAPTGSANADRTAGGARRKKDPQQARSNNPPSEHSPAMPLVERPVPCGGRADPAPRESTGDAHEEEDGLGAGKASYGDDLDTVDKRRSEELKLIGQFDS